MIRLITLGRLRLIRDGLPREAVHFQPKRLALLAYLMLTARDGAQQRDTLLALFWPESERSRARRCLRQALFHLRNELGEGVIVGAGREGVFLSTDRVWCDAVAMEEALHSGRKREALSLYAGDFLPGLFVDDSASGLEEWVERTRLHLRARAAACAWELVEEELGEGRVDSALETARRARSLSPEDEQGLRRHMALLAQVGDPAAALGAYAEFTSRLLREYEAQPSQETRILAAGLKQGLFLAPTAAGVPRRALNVVHRPINAVRMAGAGGRRSTDARVSSRWSAAAAALLFAGLALGAAIAPHPGSFPSRRLLLTEFTNHTRDTRLGAAVTEAFRAELSRVAEVRIVGAEETPGRWTVGRVPRGRVAAIVIGDVAAAGPGFTVSVQLVSVGSGRVLAAAREDVVDSKLLLPTVERLSRRIRGNVVLSLASGDTEAR